MNDKILELLPELVSQGALVMVRPQVGRYAALIERSGHCHQSYGETPLVALYLALKRFARDEPGGTGTDGGY